MSDLPLAAKLAAVRLARQVGRRGAWLLFLALLSLVYAFGLAFPTQRSLTNPTTVFLVAIMPLYAWAVLWGGVGLACLFYAFRKWDAPGYTLAMFLLALWALVFLFGWLIGDVERGYLSAVIWGAFCGVTGLIAGWRENLEES
jgi:hypothetical protein